MQGSRVTSVWFRELKKVYKWISTACYICYLSLGKILIIDSVVKIICFNLQFGG